MRILFVSNLYPSSVEPTRGLFNRSTVLALARRGHDLEVLAPVFWCPLLDSLLRHRRLPPETEVLDGIQVRHPRVLYTPGLFVYRHHVFYRRAMHSRFAAAGTRFDHAILAFAYPDAVATAPLCRAAGLPYSVAVLGSDFRVRIAQRRFRDQVLGVLRDAPRVLCPGQALRQDMIAAGIPGERIVAFNNGIDPAVFHPRQTPDATAALCQAARLPHAARVVLFVGNLVPVKGVDRLLRAWPAVAAAAALPAGQPPLCLVLIGDGPHRARLERLARELGIAGTVRLLGARPQTDVAAWMRAAHCLCLPSRSEGMPNVVLEALACGTPVVATAVGEAPYLVRDGVDGVIVPTTGDADAIVQALAGALVKAVEKQDWATAALASRVAGYTWDAAATTVLGALAGTGTTP